MNTRWPSVRYAVPPPGFHIANPKEWVWPDFTPEEMWSPPERNDGEHGVFGITTELMDKLQALRWALGLSLIVTSAYRTEAHHRMVYRELGKSPPMGSPHLKGMAVDLRLNGTQRYQAVEIAQRLGFNGIGVYDWGLHLDIRRDKQTMWAG